MAGSLPCATGDCTDLHSDLVWRASLVLGVVSLALAGCAAEDVPAIAGEIRIATGNPGGVYATYGGGIATLLSERWDGVTVTTIETGGSVENLELVATGAAAAGFTLADMAADARFGRPPFAERLDIVALARLYDNYVQLVVREASEVASVADLSGLRVSLGSPGSGTAVAAERILTVAGVHVESVRLDIEASAAALAAGDIDAFFWSGGLPTAAISELQEVVAVRLVDLQDVADELVRRYGDFYTEATVPASAYGLSSAVTTVSVPNYLVVRRDLDIDRAYWLTRILFDGQRELVDVHPEAQRLDLRLAIHTDPLDLHPGAVRWYREAHG